MFRPMRKAQRAFDAAETQAVLNRGEYGTLSTCGEDGYPYSVPLSYVYDEGALYFHCALEGQKLDNIAYCPKVSFSVVASTEVLPDKFSTKYESAVAFGRASQVEGDEKQRALLKLIEKYSPDFVDAGKQYIQNAHVKTAVYKIDIEHLTGKGRR